MTVEKALERRVVTVLFADLAGFTTLGETLDPEDLGAVQDAYFGTARETIARYGGTLEKFIGDAVVAVFGVPRARDDDAERAVRAGLALVGAVEQLSAGVGLEPNALHLRVGVNTGEVIYGEDGPDRGAVTGDAVNVAARLQAAAAPGTVLVGETTALAVEWAVELAPVAALELKGKAAPVRARRALTVRPEPSREEAMGGLRAPILGRTAELRFLRDTLARDGAVRCLIVAPPGVGKTRLVDELAGTTEAVVCRARLRAETRAPYAAVAQLVLSVLPEHVRTTADESETWIRERLAAAGTPPGRADVLAQELLALAWPERLRSAELDRDALFTAWTEGLEAVAAGSPSLWIAEDVHWAGGDVLAFLAHAGAAPTGTSRLVLATARPSLLEHESTWCEDAHVLDLQPLPPADSHRLVRALIGDALPEELVERVAVRADGNPLFVEELLRAWISAGVLQSSGDGWRLAVEQHEVALPTTVQALYSAQIDDLPDRARRVARHSSVAGRRFPERGLGALDVEDGAAGIEVLVRRALLSGPFPDPLGKAFTFRHALLRDAAYAGLARRDRARLHVALAVWIEQEAGAHLPELAEVIAVHYAAALEHAPALAPEVAEGLDRETIAVRAAAWYERAAEAALALAAHDAARELLRRSLVLTPDPLVLDRSRRWLRLGEATAIAADMDEAERALSTAVELARTSHRDGDPAARQLYAEAVAATGRVLYEQVQFQEQFRLAEETLVEIGEREDVATGRLLLLRSSASEGLGLDVDVQLADAERALAFARVGGDTRLEFDALAWVTTLKIPAGMAMTEEYAELERAAAEQGRWHEVVQLMQRRAFTLIAGAEVAAARPLLDRAAELAEARGLTERLAWDGYAHAEAGLVSGDWDDAMEAGLRAIELGLRNSYHRAVVRTWFALVPIAGARGDVALLERARDWLAEQGLSAAHALTVSPFAHLMTSGVELVLARAGVAPEPQPDVSTCLAELPDVGGAPSWLAAVDELLGWWVERGERVAVRRALAERASARERNPWPLEPGIDALAAARLELDADRAREALGCFRACRAPWWTAKSLRVLESLGAAQPDEVEEAAVLESALGVG
jgi:class 3 adenylate cyclase/tetratricopeptide (TPR) repeat protein